MTVLTEADARPLRILVAVMGLAGGETDKNVNVAEVHALLAPNFEIERDSLEDELSLLMSEGSLDGFFSLSGLNEVFLKPPGKAAATKFDALRNDPIARLAYLQDDYLRWIYTKTEREGLHPTVSDYMATSPSCFGVPYLDQELLTAGKRLKEAGLIEGEGRLSYSAPAQPRLTLAGRQLVEAGRSVREAIADPAPVQHFTTTVHGNANVANASPGATQSITINDEWTSRTTEVLDVVQQSLTSLPTDMAAAIDALLADARDAVAKESPARAKRVLTALGSFLGDTASGALGGLLAVQIAGLLPLLG